LPKDTTSELAGLPSHYPFFMLNIKQGSCESRASTEKFPGAGPTGKTRSKNSTIKPLYLVGTIYKNPGGHGPSLHPRASAENFPGGGGNGKVPKNSTI